MKKNILFLASFVFALPIWASAQTTEIYVHNVETDTSVYQVGETISGQFDISNIGDMEASNLFYKAFLTEGKEGVLDIGESSDKKGPISIEPGQKNKFQYEIHVTGQARGNVELGIMLENAEGTPLVWFTVPVFVEGDPLLNVQPEPEEKEKEEGGLGFVLIGIIVLIALIVIGIIIKRLFPREFLVAFLLLFSGSILGLSANEALATTVYESPSNNCVSLLGISSPQPESIRNYAPGQTFNLDFSFEYTCGDLENDTLQIFSPANGTGWETASVPTSPRGVSWWESNGHKYTLVNQAPSSGENIVRDARIYRRGPYTAPSSPGEYTLYFLVSQEGSTDRELLGSQTICVTGNGECSGETASGSSSEDSTPTDVCENLEGIQTSVPDGHVLDTSGSCVASKLSCNAKPSLGKINQNITFETSIRSAVSPERITFCWDGSDDCRADGLNSLGPNSALSSRIQNFNTTGIHSFKVTAEVDNLCRIGETACDQEEIIFDPTNLVAEHIGRDLTHVVSIPHPTDPRRNPTSREYFAWIQGDEAEAEQVCEAAGYQELVSYRTVNKSSLSNHPIYGTNPMGISTYDSSTDDWTTRESNNGDTYLEMDGVTCKSPINCTECKCGPDSGCYQERSIWNPGFAFSYHTNTKYWSKDGYGLVTNVRGRPDEALEICKLLDFDEYTDYLTLAANQIAYGYARWVGIPQSPNGWEWTAGNDAETKRFRGNTLLCRRPLIHATAGTDYYETMCTVSIEENSISCSADKDTVAPGETVTFTAESTGPSIYLDQDEICWNENCKIGQTSFSMVVDENFDSTSAILKVRADGGTGQTFGPVSCMTSVEEEEPLPVSCTSDAGEETEPGLNVTYTASVDNPSGPLSYIWRNNDGQRASDNNKVTFVRRYSSRDIGQYKSVTVDVVDVNDGSKTGSKSCGVKVVEETSITESDFTAFCSISANGFDATFDAGTSNEPSPVSSYMWTDQDDEGFVEFGVPFTKTLTKTQGYNYDLLVTTTGGETSSGSCYVSIPGSSTVQAPELEFKLQNRIADSNNVCKVIMIGKYLDSCNSIESWTPTIDGEGSINIQGTQSLPPGTYTATCTGIDGTDIEVGQEKCIGNFETIEN
jgi:plastocyanin